MTFSTSQKFLSRFASAAAATLISLFPLASSALTITGFKGPWKPQTGSTILTVDSNGWNNAVFKPATFSVSVSPDESTLIAEIENLSTNESSFWIENYSSLLPAGTYSYDYAIKLNSPTGSVTEFDDFGNPLSSYPSGTMLGGAVSGSYPPTTLSYPYFGFFGVNINDGSGTAKATVTLTNFSFTYAPVPGPLPIAGAFAAFGVSRKLRKRIRSIVTI